MRTMALTLAVTFLTATAVMAADCYAPAGCEPQACSAQDCGGMDCGGSACGGSNSCPSQKMCQVVCTTKTIKKAAVGLKAPHKPMMRLTIAM